MVRIELSTAWLLAGKRERCGYVVADCFLESLVMGLSPPHVLDQGMAEVYDSPLFH